MLNPGAPKEMIAKTCFTLNTAFEQMPNKNSCLKLSDKLDSLKMRRLILTHDILQSEINEYLKIYSEISSTVGRLGIGRLKFDRTGDFIRKACGRSHHTGTTRMGHSEKDGVVNHEGKVFGIANLYVASSSNFPTPSHANPTFTIIALAIRLADKLKLNS